MIFMKFTPGAKLTGTNGMTYVADADGLISNVETHDIPALRDQGAVHATVPHHKHLKIFVGHALYFEGRTRHADANGILRDVPRDHAAPLIESGVAREATDAELAAPLPEIEQPIALPEMPAAVIEPAPAEAPPAAPEQPTEITPAPAEAE